MKKHDGISVSGVKPRLPTGKVIIFTSVMFTFLSFWRVAAVVLSDLASTAYYIGGIVEQSIGACAPYYILAVMIFSYAVRSVYIESCSMFVRGGVYRVVKEGMGGIFAKLSVSALLFDYVLTGPISGVSAGQYVMGLVLDSVGMVSPHSPLAHPETKEALKKWGSVVVACAITLYFFSKNLIGMVESSGKALKIMKLTTIMAVVILSWSVFTLATRGAANSVPFFPNLSKKVETQTADGQSKVVPKINEVTHQQEDPLGFAGTSSVGNRLRDPSKVNWWSLIGVLGILFAFGHSILAMSGEETLAQVYREVAAPKLKNFKKAALIIFGYSLVLTGGISFLAVLLIPNAVRMSEYSDNLIAGLAMNMAGPSWALLGLHAFVVLVGFLLLAGAVNTAMVGSNGVISRVAEDGVLPDSLLEPHKKYGTSHRILLLILGLQLATILISRGNVLMLGEAYAFGVVWSFIFKSAAMIILRFRKREPREFKVPFNVKIRGVEVPIGLSLIFLVLFATGVANLFSKEIATVSGLSFSFFIFAILLFSEKMIERKAQGVKKEYFEQFNVTGADHLSDEALDLKLSNRHLVWFRSPKEIDVVRTALARLDEKSTELLVMLIKPNDPDLNELTHHDLRMLTEVVEAAEKEGKPLKPFLLRSNDPAAALATAMAQLKVSEVSLFSYDRDSARREFKEIEEQWVRKAAAKQRSLRIHAFSNDSPFTLNLAPS